MRQLAWSVAAFFFVAALFLATHFLGFTLAVPTLYYDATETLNGFTVAHPLSLFSSVAFVFVCSLLFFGYAAPFAMAYEAARLSSLYAGGVRHPVDFLVIIPQFLAVAAALSFSSGVSAEFNHKGILYQGWRRGMALIAASAIALIALIFLRPYFL